MKIFTLILLLSIPIANNAQILEKHIWNNRIIIIISDNEASDLVKLQLELLNKPKQLEERKLIIYTVFQNKFKIENKTESDWINNSELYSKYNPDGKPFKIILIGLDGNLKLSQNKVLSSEVLFSKIDSMPMRRREIKGNHK